MADGGQTSVPWRLSRSVTDSVGPAGALSCRIFAAELFEFVAAGMAQKRQFWRRLPCAVLRLAAPWRGRM